MIQSKYMTLFPILLLFFFASFIYPREIYSNSVIYQDNFEDNDVSDWVVTRNTCSASWDVRNQEYGIAINHGGGCVTETIPRELLIPNNHEYKYEVDMRLSNSIGADRNFVFKYKDKNNWEGIHIFGSLVFFQRVVNGVGQPPTFPNQHLALYPFVPDESYHFTVDVLADRTDLYINNVLIFSLPQYGTPVANHSAGLQASRGTRPSEVWFDNIKVTSLEDGTGPFELPIEYDGRGEDDNEEEFVAAFLDRYTSLFDHDRESQSFTNFMGTTQKPYKKIVCLKEDKSLCYDSHNGVDFSRTNESSLVKPVATGKVEYRSPDTPGKGNNKCIPKGGFGCVVVAKHPTEEFGDVYALYAHLEEIYVPDHHIIEDIDEDLGLIGNTGGTSTGKHLHFGSMKLLPAVGTAKFAKMDQDNWNNIVTQISNSKNNSLIDGGPSSCTYTAPNGLVFASFDPNGWSGDYDDPWELHPPVGCGLKNEALWKYPIQVF